MSPKRLIELIQDLFEEFMIEEKSLKKQKKIWRLFHKIEKITEKYDIKEKEK